MITTEPLLLIMAFVNFVLAIQAMGWLKSHIVAASYTEPPATMIMTKRPEPLLLIIAAGNFGLAIMGLFTPHIVAGSVALDLWLARQDEAQRERGAQASRSPVPIEAVNLEACFKESVPEIIEGHSKILKKFGQSPDTNPLFRLSSAAVVEYFIAQLESKDGKKNFTDGNGALKVLTLTKKELEWLRTVHAPTIAENANEIVAACYQLKEFGARLDPFYRPLQPV